MCCAKKFKNAYHLIVHEQVHTGENCSCMFFDKRFSELERHLSMCTYCNVIFLELSINIDDDSMSYELK